RPGDQHREHPLGQRGTHAHARARVQEAHAARRAARVRGVGRDRRWPQGVEPRARAPRRRGDRGGAGAVHPRSSRAGDAAPGAVTGRTYSARRSRGTGSWPSSLWRRGPNMYATPTPIRYSATIGTPSRHWLTLSGDGVMIAAAMKITSTA